AVIVVDQFRSGMTGHAELRFQPVGRDHDNGAGLARQGAGHAPEKMTHAHPGIGGIPVHEETGAAAMWNEQYRLACCLVSLHDDYLLICMAVVSPLAWGRRTGQFRPTLSTPGRK